FSDLIVANAGSDMISVFLGIGDGSLAAKVDYPTGQNPISVTIMDLNGDKISDLAVANSQSNFISVLIGIGNGTFTAREDYQTGPLPTVITSADMDLDGDIDLIVANDSTVGVFLNFDTFSARLMMNASVEQSDTISLDYRIDKLDSTSVNILVEYTTEAGSPWALPTLIGNVIDIDSDKYQGTLLWDSFNDLPGLDIFTIQLRITPYDADSTGRSYTTKVFHIDNNRVPLVSLGQVEGEQRGDIAIPYQLTDAENDS
ncbi:unnamed protein product, partial [marine sediment metagenome]